jgi:peptidyl-prolyl cis-trans isomerase C
MVLAGVNDEPVTVQQLEDTFTSMHQGHGVFLAGKGAVREFLDKVIDRRLLLQEARRVRADQNAEIAKFGEEVRAKRASDAFFADQLKRVKVSDDEVKAAWERLDARINARHILVDTREDADRALARVKAGEDFGEVAARVSVAPTASRGGDMGIVRWSQLAPALEDRLWPLNKGDVSEPFETEEGWNVLLVVDRTSVERPKLEQVEKQVRAKLMERAKRRRSEALFRELRDHWKGVIDEAPVLQALVSETAPSEPTKVVVEAGGERITMEQALKLINTDAARKLRPARQRLEVRWLLQGELNRILVRKEALRRGYGERPEIVYEGRKDGGRHRARSVPRGGRSRESAGDRSGRRGVLPGPPERVHAAGGREARCDARRDRSGCAGRGGRGEGRQGVRRDRPPHLQGSEADPLERRSRLDRQGAPGS